jgi:mannonate dehydratase
MWRRTFLQASSAAALAADSIPTEKIPLPPVQPGRMKLGTQHGSSNSILRACAAFGCHHICSSLPSAKLDEAWSVDSLSRLRERVEAHGIHLDMVPLPLSSKYIAQAEYPAIMLAQSPQRDRAIDDLSEMIRRVAKVGIPAVKFNMTILGVVRSQPTRGRGGAQYSTFVYSKAKQEPALTEAGAVGEAQWWERVEYFLKKVVPVATEYKVRLACHPHDPPMPPTGFRGVVRPLGTFAGLKRFVQVVDSPYLGLNFCQGTICEGLENPNEQIHDIIRYFGQRRKIFNVHFRNIQGKFLDFRETFPDDGDVDFLRAIRTYREVGYDGMLMPDHVPKIEGDAGGQQAFAYAFGYINALLQMVYG